MKRSEINRLVEKSIHFFDRFQFKLPVWAYWRLEDWKRVKKDSIQEIMENMLGWDLTDYGGGDFTKKGLVLFTIRNGNIHKDKKPYAEKAMIVLESQEAPMHFHWNKMEDIINRGGGVLELELFNSDSSEKFSNEPFTVRIDGISKAVQPGDKVQLHPGESICLEPFVYHRFTAVPGKGPVFIGEVSAVNDDHTDNRFYEPQGRFPEIIEDTAPEYLLVNDYQKFL